VVLPAHPTGGSNVLPLGQQKLGICNFAVALVAGHEPPFIDLCRVLHIVDTILNGPPYRPALAGVQRHDTCGCHYILLKQKERPARAGRRCYSSSSDVSSSKASSRKSSSSSQSSSYTNRSLGGKRISYICCASARTSGRRSLVRLRSQASCSLDNRHGRFSSRLTVIISAFFSGGREAQALQICAAWPRPLNFSFALYSPHTLQ